MKGTREERQSRRMDAVSCNLVEMRGRQDEQGKPQLVDVVLVWDQVSIKRKEIGSFPYIGL